MPTTCKRNDNIKVQNFIMILLKLYIYQTNHKECSLPLQGFKMLLNKYYQTEKTAACVIGESDNFDYMWDNYKLLLQS